MERTNTCCFIGHRRITITNVLKTNLYTNIENLIINKNVHTFLFGSKSQFNDLCYEIVSKIKNKHPNINRIYVRAEFPYIDNNYKEYLLQRYEDTYFPTKIVNAGKAIYIERNYEMINNSQFCIAYYDNKYAPFKRQANKNQQTKSGTKLAYDYAMKKNLNIINVFY